MATSARYGWELPDLPDAPNVPYAFAQFSAGVEGTMRQHGPPSAQARVSVPTTAQAAATWVTVNCDVFDTGVPELFQASAGGIKIVQPGRYLVMATLVIATGNMAFNMGVSTDANPPYRSLAAVTSPTPAMHGAALAPIAAANTTIKLWAWGATAGWIINDQTRLELIVVT